MTKTLSDKSVVQIVVQQCLKLGLKEVVISPGSRNAPLTLSFNVLKGVKCYTIVDERSAGFFALGMAQQLKRPVAVLCTSGTAALNYAPAVAEAFYQEIPLLILTADRPPEWIGQADGQTINQSNIFANYIRYKRDLPVQINHSDDQWYVERSVSEAFEKMVYPVAGPAHINIPLREPLYGRTLAMPLQKQPYHNLMPATVLDESQLRVLTQEWSNAEAVMLLTGVMLPDAQLNRALNHLAENANTVVLTETSSNLKGDRFIQCIDRQVFSINTFEIASFKPSLLITFGGQIVSKQIKSVLRNHPPKAHWHISLNENVIDTFQHLTMNIKMKPSSFFSQVAPKVQNTEGRYRHIWQQRSQKNKKIHMAYTHEVPWSDFKALAHIFAHIPEGTVLHLANSTPVRYAQLFQDEIKVNSFSNRGTSGIDGSVSTAVGAAMVLDAPNLLVTGDLSFFYDSNGLWNKYLKQNFKVVVINNGGGGIFRFIPGPAETAELEEFFEAKHQQSAKYIAKAFGLNYFSCSNGEELISAYQRMMECNDKASLLEVFTPGELNGKILRKYFKNLQTNR
ncbi:2-succinyl-5-enolpyruvyl-6-hydroxy-3-cyclohexene-1-carboxylate synthase [Saccharicrinis carchari]|uniref:2-succinyl-5-enolpyruvyl-6-hydroxy-3-cyclohexene-1-carboxylate synthase n=1 Tax=Saccharicrinis carchari TaxID=1168039 RepID=A0A521D157_SACCC|nr:2-succinyl-5-enolpyruvyl-6-hydroxy-3-cyclohexene-1-carboxylic-acid synthase [Saccharicrinis carchari]SMO64640.1 2-succinyl-5-enolpyruvyl-6-hydroxy-3-cyclohexene-1-carboxylate synthase [Saccharicrinis carchari]